MEQAYDPQKSHELQPHEITRTEGFFVKVRGPFVLLRGSWTIKLPSNIAAINAMNFRDTTLKEKQNQISLTCTGLALECVNGLPLRAITFGSNQREQ